MKQFEYAELETRDPEILKRVKFAKLPVTYLKISRMLGYYNQNNEYIAVPAAASMDPEAYKNCKALLDELKDTVNRENITHFSETRMPNAQWKIAKWDEVLASMQTSSK